MRAVTIVLTVLASAAPGLGQSTPLITIDMVSDGQAAVGSDLNGDQVREPWVGESYPGADLSGRTSRTVASHPAATGTVMGSRTTS